MVWRRSIRRNGRHYAVTPSPLAVGFGAGSEIAVQAFHLTEALEIQADGRRDPSPYALWNLSLGTSNPSD